MQCLRQNRRRLAKPGAGLLSSLDCANMDQHVSQATLRDAMHTGGDAFATTHFRGNDDFALVLGLDREQARARNVCIKERKVRIPREHGVEHLSALCAIGHEVHGRARHELHASPAGVDVYHYVTQREENGREVVCNLAG